MNIADNINKQPVGRATMVVNDKCGDPTNYLYKINHLAYHTPNVVKDIAIAMLNEGESLTPEAARKVVDVYYNQRNQ